MALILTLCFAFLMFYLAHSTLLHYLAEESGGVPIEASRIVLPWPAKGRIGAAFAGLTGTLFLCGALFGVRFRPIEPAQFGGLLFMSAIFFIVPAGHYACFLYRRLVRDVDGTRGNARGRLMFVPRPATRGEYAFPLACIAVFEGIAVLWDMLG